MKAVSYTKTGSKQETQVTLDKAVFEVSLNADLIKQAYSAYLSNGRQASAKTLTRGEVSGGGKKPWRQKGTGRARFGSSRVPQWRHGGIVFGPTGLENYTKELPTKMKRAAIRQSLSAQAKDGNVVVIEDFTGGEGKVKDTVKLLSKLGAEGNILLVVKEWSDMVSRSTRNLAGLEVVTARYLNVFNCMNADKIVITKAALEEIGSWLGEKK